MIFSEKLSFVLILTTLTLIKLISAVNSDNKQDAKCLLPMETGPCRMSLTRFYYNAKTDTCEEFKFGGCKGNDNKFGFKQTCEAACKKSTGEGSPSTLATTTRTTDTAQFATEQLKSDTVKEEVSNVAATTIKPGAARTTVKTLISTAKGGTTTTK